MLYGKILVNFVYNSALKKFDYRGRWFQAPKMGGGQRKLRADSLAVGSYLQRGSALWVYYYMYMDRVNENLTYGGAGGGGASDGGGSGGGVRWWWWFRWSVMGVSDSTARQHHSPSIHVYSHTWRNNPTPPGGHNSQETFMDSSVKSRQLVHVCTPV